ncbi:hypothetical protein QCA50_015381 [Cerrena zonata]|uniref:BBC1/AIM3 cysteine proteinase-fold domain-containing protein n=1 Tax=Cerrena zonata TaxID=2478898 RepID=A0AAW0FQU0_9APHY
MDIPDSPPHMLESSPEPEPQFTEEPEEEEAPPPPPPGRRQSRHVPSPLQQRKHEKEILDDEDGDPIDPGFHSPLKSPTLPSAGFPSAPLSPPSPPPVIPTSARPISPAKVPPPPPVPTAEEGEAEEDEEQTRRRTIAERMAKLGGIRFGAPPMAPAPMRRPQPPPPKEEETGTETEQQEEARSEGAEEPPEEEDEYARKQRIAARIAGMGGMRFGMMPTPMSPPAPVRRATIQEEETRPPPPPRHTDDIEDEGVHVDAEESEAEEVTHAEAQQEEAPPPVPDRTPRRGSSTHAPQRAPPVPTSYARPPIPQGRPPIPPTSPRIPSPTAGRKSSVSTVASHSAPSPPAREVPIPPVSDYVMVDEPESVEEPPPPPPPRPTRAPPSRSAPVPPPAPSHAPSGEASSSWQLPTIPTSPFDFETETDLSLSGQWSEDSTNYPSSAAPPPPPTKSQPPPPPTDVQLSADDLMALWGRVGVQIHEVAATLFDKSKKSLIGDGSYTGFIDAALSHVPNALRPSTSDSFGYLIYSQAGPSVQRRASDIMPGDIIVLQDAKLKGHKGIQIYHQNVGAGEPVVAIVADFETKKSKVKVFQANQHVGHQSVESTSYRLEDLKSGTVKVFRVLSS